MGADELVKRVERLTEQIRAISENGGPGITKKSGELKKEYGQVVNDIFILFRAYIDGVALKAINNCNKKRKPVDKEVIEGYHDIYDIMEEIRELGPGFDLFELEYYRLTRSMRSYWDALNSSMSAIAPGMWYNAEEIRDLDKELAGLDRWAQSHLPKNK